MAQLVAAAAGHAATAQLAAAAAGNAATAQVAAAVNTYREKTPKKSELVPKPGLF
jgi:hypothetical protein